MNKDEIAGAVKEKGAQFRGAVANVTGDKEAKADAAVDEAAGKTRKNWGKIKDAVEDAVS